MLKKKRNISGSDLVCFPVLFPEVLLLLFVFFGDGSGGGVAEGRTTECLENIIHDGNSYQMLQKLDKPLQPCFAGLQPNLSDTPQLKWDQHKTLITPSRKLLQIHGPLKCLAENKMFYKCVFMNVFDRVSFCFRQHSLGHKI